jgi:hypothetical protein
MEFEVRAIDGSGTGDPAPDVIELGSRQAPWQQWRRPGTVWLAGVALIAGAAAGYLIGTQRAEHAAGAVAGQAPTSQLLVSAGEQPPTATDKRCSVQLGDQLQLGVEIVNLSATGVTLTRANVELPLGGLRVARTAWGACGQLSATAGTYPYLLPPGATIWLSATFDVLTTCPGPLPVQFSVEYAEAGANSTADLGGFDDLGGIPSTGCAASPG